jgi:hypothetical protein
MYIKTKCYTSINHLADRAFEIQMDTSCASMDAGCTQAAPGCCDDTILRSSRHSLLISNIFSQVFPLKKVFANPLPLHSHQDTKHDHDECTKRNCNERYCNSRYWESPIRQRGLYTEVPDQTCNPAVCQYRGAKEIYGAGR